MKVVGEDCKVLSIIVSRKQWKRFREIAAKKDLKVRDAIAEAIGMFIASNDTLPDHGSGRVDEEEVGQC